jgi:tRNA (5-methylaminomethyl-2-thiouridylate)-methyltransferase
MKIAVLTSGGVDSSVALALLKHHGYEVTAFYLKIWLEDELSYLGSCPWQEDLSYVESLCSQLGVPLQIISMQQVYWQHVVNYLLDQVKKGYTPNPDMLCNQYVKFGAFLEAIGQEYTHVATGHYAQIQQINTQKILVQSPDAIKDQTYFLARLSPAQLNRALFPIGSYTKEEVRALAHKLNVPAKNRKDSQGICFLGKLNFNDFLAHHLGTRKGDLIEIETGTKVGEHQGFWFYTIGQRKGIGLAGGPWYVVRKDVATNTVLISRHYYDARQARNSFHVSNCMWYVKDALRYPLKVKIRHGQYHYECTVSPQSESDTLLVDIGVQDQGIAAGQFAVFYHESTCVGSGVIQ